MATAKTFEFLIIWQFIFIGIIVLYGADTGLLQVNNAVTGPLNTLLQPFPDLCQSLSTSGQSGSCLSCSDITSCTKSIALGIAYMPLLGFSVLNKIGASFFFISALTNFFSNGLGIPFLPQIEGALIVLTVVFGIAILKPGGHGA